MDIKIDMKEDQKIPIKIIREYYLDNTVSILLFIIFLYINNIINRKKYVSMLRSYFSYEDRNIYLNLWHKNILHCSITGEWFNDICLHEYLDALEIALGHKIVNDITLKDINDALSIITCGKKGVIMYELSKILECIIDCYGVIEVNDSDRYYTNILLPIFGEYLDNKFNYVSYGDYHVSGYCCYDCDGDYEEYKHISYENVEKAPLIRRLREIVCTQLSTINLR